MNSNHKFIHNNLMSLEPNARCHIKELTTFMATKNCQIINDIKQFLDILRTTS